MAAVHTYPFAAISNLSALQMHTQRTLPFYIVTETAGMGFALMPLTWDGAAIARLTARPS